MPTLRFEIQAAENKTFNLVLEAHEYMDRSPEGCAPTFQSLRLPPNLGRMWVLGQALLRKYYMVFDAKMWRVGLAAAAHTSKKRVPKAPVAHKSHHKAEVCEDDNKHMQEAMPNFMRRAEEDEDEDEDEGRDEDDEDDDEDAKTRADEEDEERRVRRKRRHQAPFSLPGCQSFAQMGYCHRFKPLAHHYCKKSCHFCKPSKKHHAHPKTSEGVTIKGGGMSVSHAAHMRLRDHGEM